MLFSIGVCAGRFEAHNVSGRYLQSSFFFDAKACRKLANRGTEVIGVIRSWIVHRAIIEPFGLLLFQSRRRGPSAQSTVHKHGIKKLKAGEGMCRFASDRD